MTRLERLLAFPGSALHHGEVLAAELLRLPRVLDAVLDMRDDLRALRDRIDGLDAKMTPLPGELSAMRSGLEAMATDLAVMRTDVAPMDEDLSSVETAVLAMAPRLRDLSEQIDGMRTDLAGVPFIKKS